MGEGTPKLGFLVVDDEQDVLDSIRRLLRKHYVLHLALSAAEGLKMLEEHEIHLVMTDQRMPEMSGVEFLEQVRQNHPKMVRMLFTGYSDFTAVIDAVNRGHIYRYIHKPFEPAEFKLVVAQAAEYYLMREERQQLLTQLAEQNQKLQEQHAALSEAYEELKTLDRMRTVFMEVISHELNTPTSIIIGYASLLQRPAIAADEQGKTTALSGIKSSGLRLKRITEKIAKMLAASTPTVTLEYQKINVASLVETITNELQPVLALRSQAIEADTESQDLTLMADEAYLRDMLMNLVVNAIKFSEDGKTIWVSAGHSTIGDRDAVELRVRDEGVGIHPDDRDRIFDAFFGTFQSKYHSSGDFGFQQRGIGLGLAIVEKFAALHGGNVQFHSEVGQGTEFKVTLPVEPPTDYGTLGT